jgi:2-polyprenyl-3-methyl-5-hydroxy-6-metoxy-1,4-benzoquinol methylase
MMTKTQAKPIAKVAGTEGYTDDAGWLIPRYESVDFLEKYRAVVHLFPKGPGLILDVGAGTGVDAGWLAQKGHHIVAVEPVAAFREVGGKLHPSHRIEWLDDSLPTLSKVVSQEKLFDVVLLSAVWNHLSSGEREQAMPNLAALVAPGRLLILSIRHGPSPANRRMFNVSVDETIRLAFTHRLKLVANAQTASTQLLNRQAGVTWSWLAFESESPCVHE